jgi:hypothetical protein
MLDADPARLVKTGKVTIDATGVVVEGFEGENTSCRDLTALAALWAIGELQRELLATLERPGGGKIGVG